MSEFEETEEKKSADDNEQEEGVGRNPRINKFAVAFLDAEHNNELPTSDANSETEIWMNENEQKTKTKNKRKNKRKGTKKQQLTKTTTAKDEESLLEEFVRQLSMPKASPANAGQQQNLMSDPLTVLETLLKIDPRSLDPDAELRRLLGRTFGAEQRRRGGQQQRRVGVPLLYGSRLTKPRGDWPPLRQIGFHLSIDDERSTANSADCHADGDNEGSQQQQQIQWFAFCHNEQYQNQQQLFWMYQRQMDHDGILNDILLQNPYHLDSLLTFAEVLNVQEDYQRSRDAIERGIFACEGALHSNFQLFSPLHRLDYGLRENRAFFLLIHRHMLNQLQRRCFHTAFQFAKLIFAKDPSGDPMGLLLAIDMLALKGRSPEFLLDFFAHFKQKRRLDLLPNFLFSLPLAHLALCANETDGKAKAEREMEAQKSLEEALLRFPFVLAQLLDRLQVKPDSAVDFDAYLCSTAIYRETVGSRLLAHIYVHHSAEELWRPNLAWLERATHLALPRLAQRRGEMDEWAQNRKRCFIGLPLNLVRHCILHGIRPSDAQLAQLLDEQTGPNIVADPCPPKEGRRQRYEQANFDELLQLHGINSGAESAAADAAAQRGIVGTFLRTLLPDQEQTRLDSLLEALRQRIGLGDGSGPSTEAAPAVATDTEQEQQPRND